MLSDHKKHHRRSIRLQKYDYASLGAYFITICAQDRACIFGDLVNESVRLSLAGQVVQRVWSRLPEYFEQVKLDSFVVMPNHIHAIVWIVGMGDQSSNHDVFARPTNVDAAEDSAHAAEDWHGTESGSLGAIIQNFKSVTTRKIHALRRMPVQKVWQRNYWERVIREYIARNPVQWQWDRDNPTMA